MQATTTIEARRLQRSWSGGANTAVLRPIAGESTRNRASRPSIAQKECTMTLILRSALLALATTIGLAAPLAVPAEAQTTKIKLVLNWKYQGPQGMFFL